jgi:hypothetical protein
VNITECPEEAVEVGPFICVSHLGSPSAQVVLSGYFTKWELCVHVDDVTVLWFWWSVGSWTFVTAVLAFLFIIYFIHSNLV